MSRQGCPADGPLADADRESDCAGWVIRHELDLEASGVLEEGGVVLRPSGIRVAVSEQQPPAALRCLSGHGVDLDAGTAQKATWFIPLRRRSVRPRSWSEPDSSTT